MTSREFAVRPALRGVCRVSRSLSLSRRSAAAATAAFALLGGVPHASAAMEGLGLLRAGEGVYELFLKVDADTRRLAAANPQGEAAPAEDSPVRRSSIEQRATIRLAPEDQAAAAAAAKGDPVIVRGSIESVTLIWREDAGAGGELVETAISRPKVTMEEEPVTPTADALRAIAAALGEADIRLFVIAGEGVARIGGLDGVGGALEAHPDVSARIVGAFAPMELARALSPIFSACGGATAEAPAQGWKAEEDTDLGPAGTLRIETAWTPDAEAPGRFTGSSVLTVLARDKGDAEGVAAPVASVESQRTADEMRWDGDADTLQSHRAVRAFESTLGFGGLRVRSKVESERTITRAAE